MGEAPSISACPACAAGASAVDVARADSEAPGRIMLSVPTVHCGACIAAVERRLENEPGIRAARVNLTLKRVAVDAEPSVDAAHLIAVLDGIGYEAHELDASAPGLSGSDRRGRELLMRLGVAGFAMMNVMLLSIAVWSGATDATRDMFHWISAAIALPAVTFAAQPFFVSAWSALRVGRLNMDVPISLAIILAAGLSVYETSQGGEHAYFDAALSLTFFLLVGRYLDHRTRSVARSAAEELAALEVPRALRLTGELVPIAELVPGDLIRVLPGERVPADGIVEKGESEVDRSLLTGETLPVAAAPGATLSAGEVNLTGPLVVQVMAAGKDSSLRRMADLVAVAESSRNRYTSLADRAARIYAPAVHILAFLAFAGWLIATGDARLAINIAVAVLIITCPCALGLAVPAVTTAASGRLFKAGMLIKSATALERLAEVDTVVFDKTGTLTRGEPEPEQLSGFPREALAIARALATASAHPLARSLAHALERAGVEPARIDDLHEVPGAGVEGIWNGQKVRLGRAAWLSAPTATTTATHLGIGDQEPLTFAFNDRLREGAASAVKTLKAMGKDVILLSGDAPAAVGDIANRLGIDAWEAGMLPEDKAKRITALSDAGRRVLMVGDGLNDTAALAAAHVSMSPATALEAARVVSDIVLLGNSLEPLGEAIKVSKAATRRIKENFGIAVLYNLVAVPIALFGFATPLAAALAMSGSSITVSLNSLRLAKR